MFAAEELQTACNIHCIDICTEMDEEMDEYTAEEKYREFENLRNRFGSDGVVTAGAREQDRSRTAQHHQAKNKRRPGSGRPDPRSTAPPLVPLVEEESPVDVSCMHYAWGGGAGWVQKGWG